MGHLFLLLESPRHQLCLLRLRIVLLEHRLLPAVLTYDLVHVRQEPWEAGGEVVDEAVWHRTQGLLDFIWKLSVVVFLKGVKRRSALLGHTTPLQDCHCTCIVLGISVLLSHTCMHWLVGALYITHVVPFKK